MWLYDLHFDVSMDRMCYYPLSHAFCYILSQKSLLNDYFKRELTYIDFLFRLFTVKSEGSNNNPSRREAVEELLCYSRWLSHINDNGFDFIDGNRRSRGTYQREYNEGNST
jgi:hypothetical protein